MISELDFEFALEKANFLENFRKNKEEEKSRGVLHQLQGHVGRHHPPEEEHRSLLTTVTKFGGRKHNACCSRADLVSLPYFTHADLVSLPYFIHATHGPCVGACGCSGQSLMTTGGCVLASRVHPSNLWCQTPTIFCVLSEKMLWT